MTMKRTAIFVANLEQYQIVCGQEARAPGIIVTISLDVYAKALDEEKDAIYLWSYLSEQQEKRNRERAKSIYSQIIQAARGCCSELECQLFENYRYDLYLPLLHVININDMLEGYFSEHGLDEAIYFKGQGKIQCQAATDDLLSAGIEWFLEKRKVPSEAINLDSVSNETVRNKKEIDRLDSTDIEGILAHGLNSIDVMWHGLDVAEQDALLAEVNRGNKRDWLIIGTHHVAYENVAAMNLYYLYKLPFLVNDSLESFRRWIDKYKETRGAEASALPEMLKSELFGFVWSGLVEWLAEGVRFYFMGRFLAQAAGCRNIVMGYDMYGWAKSMVAGMIESGIVPLSVHHTGLSWIFTFDGQIGSRANVVAWGEYDGREMRKRRSSDCAVIEAGALRSDIERIMRQMSEYRSKVPGNNKGNTIRIAILTGRSDRLGSMSNTHHLKVWKDLVLLSRRRPEWEFRIAPHPRTDFKYFYESKIFDGSNIRLSTKTSKETCQESDCALFVTYPTTAGIEAIACQIPLFFLNQAVYSGEESSIEKGGAKIVENVAALESEILRIIEDDAYRIRLLDESRQFMERAVKTCGPEAAKNVLEFLRQPQEGPSGLSESNHGLHEWIFQTTAFIAWLCSASRTKKEIKRFIQLLKEKRKNLKECRSDLVDVKQLAGYWFSRILTRYGTMNMQHDEMSLLDFMLHFHWALPRSMRLSFDEQRNFCVQALIKNQERPASTWNHFTGRICPLIIAPGRIKRTRLFQRLRRSMRDPQS